MGKVQHGRVRFGKIQLIHWGVFLYIQDSREQHYKQSCVTVDGKQDTYTECKDGSAIVSCIYGAERKWCGDAGTAAQFCKQQQHDQQAEGTNLPSQRKGSK